MQYAILVALVLTAIMVVSAYRRKRDRDDLAAKVSALGGQVVSLKRVKQGHPFPSIGRGWWAWKVLWKDGARERTSWALTTREGIKDWRD